MIFIKVVSEIVITVLVFIIIFQISTIFHEFGHALPALIFTKDNVKMTLGKNDKKIKKLILGRLDIEIKGFNPFRGSVNWNDSNLTRTQKLLCLAGGPIASLILGIVLLLIEINIKNGTLAGGILLKETIVFARNYQLFTFLSVSIPIIYPKWWLGYAGYASDGYQILKLMKADKVN